MIFLKVSQISLAINTNACKIKLADAMALELGKHIYSRDGRRGSSVSSLRCTGGGVGRFASAPRTAPAHTATPKSALRPSLVCLVIF